jgi:hypothetical protein
MDADGDYFVLFPDHPCPHGEPVWYVPAWAIIPLDDPNMCRALCAALEAEQQ